LKTVNALLAAVGKQAKLGGLFLHFDAWNHFRRLLIFVPVFTARCK